MWFAVGVWVVECLVCVCTAWATVVLDNFFTGSLMHSTFGLGKTFCWGGTGSAFTSFPSAAVTSATDSHQVGVTTTVKFFFKKSNKIKNYLWYWVLQSLCMTLDIWMEENFQPHFYYQRSDKKMVWLIFLELFIKINYSK